jgi:flagellar motor switch/type III secretory pathway protein FliN
MKRYIIFFIFSIFCCCNANKPAENTENIQSNKQADNDTNIQLEICNTDFVLGILKQVVKYNRINVSFKEDGYTYTCMQSSTSSESTNQGQDGSKETTRIQGDQSTTTVKQGAVKMTSTTKNGKSTTTITQIGDNPASYEQGEITISKTLGNNQLDIKRTSKWDSEQVITCDFNYNYLGKNTPLCMSVLIDSLKMMDAKRVFADCQNLNNVTYQVFGAKDGFRIVTQLEMLRK